MANERVLLPAPGCPAHRTTSASTKPPPKTLSNSLIPVLVRCIGVLFNSLIVAALFDGFTAPDVFSPARDGLEGPFGVGASSTNV